MVWPLLSLTSDKAYFTSFGMLFHEKYYLVMGLNKFDHVFQFKLCNHLKVRFAIDVDTLPEGC